MESKLAYILNSDMSEKEVIKALIDMLQEAMVYDVREVRDAFKSVYDSSMMYESVAERRPEDALKDIRDHLLETINNVDEVIDNYIKKNNLKV